jgi:hypothetical protein
MRIGSGVQINWTLDQGLGTLDLFGEFEKAEQEKGFVRGAASGAVDFEVGEFSQNALHERLVSNFANLIKDI